MKWFDNLKRRVADTLPQTPTGSGDHHDSVVERNRLSRWFTLLTISAFLLIAPVYPCVILVTALWENGAWLGVAIGLYAGIRFCGSYVTGPGTKIVPVAQGLVTLDNFRGDMVIYGPAWHPSHPWESVDERSNFSLEIATLILNEDYPTKTDTIRVQAQLQMKPILNRLDRYRMVDVTTVEEGLRAVLSSALTEMLGPLDATEALANIKDLSDRLDEVIANEPPNKSLFPTGSPDADLSSANTLRDFFKEAYGLRIVLTRIIDLDYSDEVKEARAAEEEARSFPKMVALLANLDGDVDKLRKRLDSNGTDRITPQEYAEYRREARIIAGESDERIFTVSGLPEAAQAFLKRWS